MSRVNRPVITFVERAALDVPARRELFEFCDRFSSRQRARFEAQLDKDDTVFLVRGDRTGHLVGFGTLTVHDVAHGRERAGVIYTGWAMASPAFRGHGINQRAGLATYARLRRREPFRPLYWMMTASTLNSYLLMARNLRLSYPRAGVPWPDRERAYVEQVLAAAGTPWEPATGVIRRSGASFYREGRVEAVDGGSPDPDIAFYARANPGQAAGDTLVCLAPLTLGNFGFMLRRMLGAGRRRRLRIPASGGEPTGPLP